MERGRAKISPVSLPPSDLQSRVDVSVNWFGRGAFANLQGPAVAAGGGFDALQVGSCGRFDHGDGAHQFAARHAGKPVAFLFLAAVGEDVMRHDTVDAGTEVDSCLSEFFRHHGFVGEGSSPSAVFFGHVGEQDACRACFCPGFRIGAMLLAPASLMRREFFLYEAADRLAEHPQLVIHPGGLVGNGWHNGA